MNAFFSQDPTPLISPLRDYGALGAICTVLVVAVYGLHRMYRGDMKEAIANFTAGLVQQRASYVAELAATRAEVTAEREARAAEVEEQRKLREADRNAFLAALDRVSQNFATDREAERKAREDIRDKFITLQEQQASRWAAQVQGVRDVAAQQIALERKTCEECQKALVGVTGELAELRRVFSGAPGGGERGRGGREKS